MEYSQNATLVFISAYSVYVFSGKITIPLSTRLYQQRYLFWLRGKDLNQRPSGYEPDELPTAPPRDIGGGEGWIRTNEAKRGRFTVCSL